MDNKKHLIPTTKIKLISMSDTTEQLEEEINLFLIDLQGRNNAILLDIKVNVKDLYASVTYTI